MAFQLPQSRRPVRQVQIQKRNVPLEQIIAVQGQSPVATGIDVAGKVIGQALERRAQLRRQGEQVAAISKATGIDLSGIGDPAVAASIGKSMADMRSEEARAREAAGIRREQSDFNNDMRRLMFLNTDERRREEIRQRDERFQDKQVNLYSQQLDKSGIPNAIGSAERLLSLLPARGEDVPGYGSFDRYRPDFLTSDKGKILRQGVQQLFNIELADRSGKAVTDPELKRLKTEFGQGHFATEEQLRQGVVQYLQRVRELARNVDAGVSLDIKGEYQNRGGRNVLQTFEEMLDRPSIAPAKKAESMRKKYGY